MFDLEYYSKLVIVEKKNTQCKTGFTYIELFTGYARNIKRLTAERVLETV